MDPQFPAERVVTAVVPEPGGEAAVAVVSSHEGAHAYRIDSSTVATEPLPDPVTTGPVPEVLASAHAAFAARSA